MATQSSIPDYVTNPSNPFFLHPDENPAIVILVSPLLNGRMNYNTWSRAMSIALLSKNKLGFVDGTIPIPSKKDPIYPAWLRCNAVVLSWIHKSISELIAQSIVWKDLKERFSQADVFRISDIQDDIFRLKQGDRSVSEYFTQLKILWDELEILQPLSLCKCINPCSCGAMAQMRTIRDGDHAIRFLKGLNDQYANVRSQIMLLDPLPTVNRIFAFIAQHERQLNLDANILENSFEQSHVRDGGSFNTWRGRSNISKGRGNDNRLCSHCGKINHTTDTCFLKHGFPPEYKTRNPHAANNVSQACVTYPAGEENNQIKNAFNQMFSEEQYQSTLNLIQHSKQVDDSSEHTSNLAQTCTFNVDTTASGNHSSEQLMQ
ncbi:uncharacterized protein LOC133299161 [Gastrolobium bilobum]|uniref:uncharacterized protein LOC133299161 n=1 Tax=Gastrolobium bilobum TaxID=150636 RepID=UPI002AB0E60E|nr:uncharacterized protein LOC133299161 [Gastrolobium bilobum]